MVSQYPLQIDLSALVANWRDLNDHVGKKCDCSAVVKADAYGLGVIPVSTALAGAGCKRFFVATLDEAVVLREELPDIDIFVLQGCRPGEERIFVNKRIWPVLISYGMVVRWLCFLQDESIQYLAALKLNSGMNRLGIDYYELLKLLESYPDFFRFGLNVFMSHLACADDKFHEMNVKQLKCFEKAVSLVKQLGPHVQCSLANSSGVFLGEQWHFDMVRPGAALYGINPMPYAENPMNVVVTLRLPVLQVRAVEDGGCVGYGARYMASGNRILVTVAGGYADGILRSGTHSVSAWFAGNALPQRGVVSMDTTVFDVTILPSDCRPKEGDFIEILGRHACLDHFAQVSGTIGYEVLTRLSDRLPREYI